MTDIGNPSTHPLQNVAFDSEGKFYTLSGWNELFKMNSDGSGATKIATTTYQPQSLSTKFGNYIVVLETQYTDGYVEVFDRNGNQQYFWQITGANIPSGIALTQNGNSVVIVDTNNHRIVHYSISGTHERTFGSYGTGDTQFYLPTCIDVDNNGKIYVGDAGNYRFQVFDQNFIFLGKYVGGQGPGDGQLGTMYGISADPSGNYVFATDSSYGRIQCFKKNP